MTECKFYLEFYKRLRMFGMFLSRTKSKEVKRSILNFGENFVFDANSFNEKQVCATDYTFERRT